MCVCVCVCACVCVCVCVQYGRLALESVLKSVLKGKSVLIHSENYPEDFLDSTFIHVNNIV